MRGRGRRGGLARDLQRDLAPGRDHAWTRFARSSRRRSRYADFLAPGGSAAVGVLNRRPDVGYVLVTVLPENRGRGLGTALYRTRLGLALRARRSRRSRRRCRRTTRRAWRSLAERGFQRDRAREAHAPRPDRASSLDPCRPPEGIEIVTWAERPGSDPRDLRRRVRGGPGRARCRGRRDEVLRGLARAGHAGLRRSSRRHLRAIAGDEVVGYAKFSLTAAQPETAHHDMTGVKRAWRGRGIAGALSARRSRGPRTRATSGSQRRTRSATSRSGGSTSDSATARPRAASSSAGRSQTTRDARPLRRRQDAVHEQRPADGTGDDRRDRDRLGPHACPDDAIRGVDHAGQTATRITRDAPAARRAGRRARSTRGSRAGARRPRRATSSCLPSADTSDWRAAEGAAEAITPDRAPGAPHGKPRARGRARMETDRPRRALPAAARARSAATRRTATS